LIWVLLFIALMALSNRQGLYMLYPVIEFDRLVRQMVEDQGISVDYTSVAMLMEVAVRSEQGLDTSITDLVRCWRFGTGPTVHSHLESLVKLKLISKVASPDDRRKSELRLSNAGEALLKALSTLMKKALK